MFLTRTFVLKIRYTIHVRNRTHTQTNSFGAIRYFREQLPAIFSCPQNIQKHAIYRILALYSLNPILNPNQNRTPVPRYYCDEKLAVIRPFYLILFLLKKIQSEGPYLKSFISRVLCLYREHFCSFSRYATRPRRAPYFLTLLHSTVGTKAVN